MEQVYFSFRQTVFGILKTLVVRATQNNINLTFDIDPDIPDLLIGDSLRLRQVITNLVGNAIKFTPSTRSPPEGLVALNCRLLALDDEAVTLEFCVQDTGIGIAKDKLNLIFDTFAQADGSTTRVRAQFSSVFQTHSEQVLVGSQEYGGTGLGLSISKRLAYLMQGNMWVESDVGKGSKFFFTITSQIGSMEFESLRAKMEPFQNRTVLFLDKNFDTTGITRYIEDLGLTAHVVHDLLTLKDKKSCPHIDTIVTNSAEVVSDFSFFPFLLMSQLLF